MPDGSGAEAGLGAGFGVATGFGRLIDLEGKSPLATMSGVTRGADGDTTCTEFEFACSTGAFNGLVIRFSGRTNLVCAT